MGRLCINVPPSMRKARDIISGTPDELTRSPACVQAFSGSQLRVFGDPVATMCGTETFINRSTTFLRCISSTSLFAPYNLTFAESLPGGREWTQGVPALPGHSVRSYRLYPRSKLYRVIIKLARSPSRSHTTAIDEITSLHCSVASFTSTIRRLAKSGKIKDAPVPFTRSQFTILSKSAYL